MKVVLFDGCCNLCNRTVAFIMRHDRNARFYFASLQSETGQILLKQAGVPGHKITSVVYLREEHYFMRSAAILYILKDLGMPWALGYGFIIVPRFLRDALYRLVAKMRYRLWGERKSCMLPDESVRERFL